MGYGLAFVAFYGIVNFLHLREQEIAGQDLLDLAF